MTKPSEAALRVATRLTGWLFAHQAKGGYSGTSFAQDVAAIIDAEYAPVVKKLVEALRMADPLIAMYADQPGWGDAYDAIGAALQRAKEIGG